MGKITVVGSLNMDFVMEVDHIPKAGETILSKNLEFFCGGKGANQAYTAGKIGSDITMLGAVGDDSYGNRLIENLKSVGVSCDSIKRCTDVSTGIALIPVNKDGNNSIIVVPAANNEVTVEYIDLNKHILEQSSVIIMQLEVPLETVLYVSKLAKAMGKTFILDPAPATKNIPDELIANADIIKPNETELEILTDIAVKNTEDAEKAGRRLIDRGAKSVVITLGENGALLVAKDLVKHFPGKKVEVVDTTSAGDSFTATLAHVLSIGKTMDEAINAAIEISSIVVTRKGAQSSVPDPSELRDIPFFL